MGYLNNTVVTVDAILTDVGRQLLSSTKWSISNYSIFFS
jgi:hypothetical protein